MARRLTVGALIGVAALAAAWAYARRAPAPEVNVSGSRTAAAAPLAEKAFYRIDAAPLPTCAAGDPCEVRFVLTALGAYHVNRDYPFKFIADPPPAAALDGAAAFAIDDASRGTLTVRFRPRAAGTAQLAGTFKLSVCSDDTCEIEAPKLAVSVAVR